VGESLPARRGGVYGTSDHGGRAGGPSKIFRQARAHDKIPGTKMKIRRMMFFVLLGMVIDSTADAQNYGAWLSPKVVYAGDPAVLVLPLPPFSQNENDIVLNPLSPGFPVDDNIDFHRIALERRTSGSRLLIEFAAFVPGTLELPVIEIGGDRFSGLTVTIASVIDAGKPLVLSGPAPSLAIPGTAFMLYGSMAALVVVFLLSVWFILKGRRLLEGWIVKWKRWQLFNSMRGMEKRLHKALARGADRRGIIDILSDEFRIFLSMLTGNNCRSMTAREYEKLPLAAEFDSPFLAKFFKNCDQIRFSGSDISRQDITGLLEEFHSYLVRLASSLQVKYGF
jgi:hypothetical protein